jgi:hypothetical protein
MDQPFKRNQDFFLIIETDGQDPMNTIVKTPTGEILQGVTKVNWELEAGSIPMATLTILNPKIVLK